MSNYTLTGNGQTYGSSVQPTYDIEFRLWRCKAAGGADFNVSDVTGTQFETVAPASVPPKIGPIAFQMLFTPAESVAADSLKASDPTLASFWKLIDDPRTDVVDLSLQTVQNAIEYTLNAVKVSGVAVDVPARKAQILTGVVQ
jgi:hypothetical protein